MKSKTLVAAITAAVLGLGGAVLAVAAPASAHTGNLNATAVCNTTTGEYDVTYKLTVSNTDEVGTTLWKTIDSNTFAGLPYSNAGLNLGPVSSTGSETVTLGTISVPGTHTSAPWAYAFTTWTPDHFTAGSDGGNIDLAGNCVQVTPKDASASVSVSAPSCGSAGVASVVNLNDATLEGTLATVPGSYTAVFDATALHEFSDGTTKLSVPYTIAAQLKTEPCFTTSCTASSNTWGAEPGDLNPEVTINGRLFKGSDETLPSGQAIDLYRPTSGNMQGITSFVITESTVNDETARAVIEGHAPGFVTPSNLSGFFTASTASEEVDGTQDTIATQLWYTSKIAFGNQGGQGHPVSYATLIGLIGYDNTIDAVGIHLQTGATSDSISLVSAVSINNGDCGSTSFVAPSVTFPPASTTPSTCVDANAANQPAGSQLLNGEANGGTYTLPALDSTTEKYAYESDGVTRPAAGTYALAPGQTDGPFMAHTLASAFVQPGSATYGSFTGEAEISTQYTDSEAPCYVAPTVVTPVPPMPGACNSDTNTPLPGETFAELEAAQPTGVTLTLEVDGVTVDVTADNGYALADGSPSTFTLPSALGNIDCAITGASASVNVAPAAKCGVAGVATATFQHATLDGGSLDLTPGVHTASFTADSGYKFGTGETASLTTTATYTIPAIVKCPTVKVLGFTGDDTPYLALGGLILALLGLGAIAIWFDRRRKAAQQ